MRGLAMLSSAGLEVLLPRFSAEERAWISWWAGEVRAELRRLYDAEPTRDSIAQAAASFWGALREFPESLAASLGELLAAGEDPLAGELDALRAYVEPEAARAAEWVWRAAILPLFAWVGEVSRGDDAMAAGVQGWRDLEVPSVADIRDTPEAGLLRAEFLLFAAFAGAREQRDPARVAELAYLAFEHACEGVDAFAARGVRLSDYVVDTAEQRVERTIRSAEALRAVLTQQDLETLQAVRLDSLR